MEKWDWPQIFSYANTYMLMERAEMRMKMRIGFWLSTNRIYTFIQYDHFTMLALDSFPLLLSLCRYFATLFFISFSEQISFFAQKKNLCYFCFCFAFHVITLLLLKAPIRMHSFRFILLFVCLCVCYVFNMKINVKMCTRHTFSIECIYSIWQSTPCLCCIWIVIFFFFIDGKGGTERAVIVLFMLLYKYFLDFRFAILFTRTIFVMRLAKKYKYSVARLVCWLFFFG